MEHLCRLRVRSGGRGSHGQIAYLAGTLCTSVLVVNLRLCGYQNAAHSVKCPRVNNFVEGKYLLFAAGKQKEEGREVVCYGFLVSLEPNVWCCLS